MRLAGASILRVVVVVGWYVLGPAVATIHVDPFADGADDTTVQPNALRRRIQSKSPEIIKMRWMDAGTDQPLPWRDIQPLSDSFSPSNMVLDGGYPIGGFNLEAVIESSTPIGSVQFQWPSDPQRLTFIENKAPYLMCGNVGTNILPCQNLVPASYPNVTIWSKPNAKGTKLYENGYFAGMTLLVEPPFIDLKLLNQTQVLQEFLNTNTFTISISDTPQISIQVIFKGYKSPSWFPKSVLFNLDNGSLVRWDKYEPFTLLGNTGTTWYNTYTPSIGEHSVTVTAYRENAGQGESFNRTFFFDVVP